MIASSIFYSKIFLSLYPLVSHILRNHDGLLGLQCGGCDGCVENLQKWFCSDDVGGAHWMMSLAEDRTSCLMVVYRATCGASISSTLTKENKKTKHPQLLYEAKLYNILQGERCCYVCRGLQNIRSISPTHWNMSWV